MGLRTSRPGKLHTLIALLLVLSVAAGCKQDSWTLWDSYSARFIDAQGQVIDHSAGGRTTSEGQAFAMFFALVNNDRITFERVLTWTQTNLADGDLQTHLPASDWGFDGNGNWGALNPGPSSGADLWMAYTLVEAGRLWSVSAYTNMGRKMMDQIAKTEVVDLPGFGLMLMPGPTGFENGQVYTLNSSYVPPFLLDRMAQVDPAGPWRQIALNIPNFLQQSARHGFAMDWVDYLPGDGFYPAAVAPPSASSSASPQTSVPAPLPTLDGQPDLLPSQAASPPAQPTPAPPPTTRPTPSETETVLSGGGRDAIRVYLWAGMLDAQNPARAQILNALPAMRVYLAGHDAPPQTVSDQGIPSAKDGPIGFSAAVLPYLRAFPDLSRESAKQTIRMALERNPSTGLYGKQSAYYDQNLALFSTGFLEGKFRFGQGGELNVEWTRQ